MDRSERAQAVLDAIQDDLAQGLRSPQEVIDILVREGIAAERATELVLAVDRLAAMQRQVADSVDELAGLSYPRPLVTPAGQSTPSQVDPEAARRAVMALAILIALALLGIALFVAIAAGSNGP